MRSARCSLVFSPFAAGSSRAAALIFFIALPGGGVAVAQSDRAVPASVQAASSQEAPDEVIVHGKRLGDLRLKVQAAREHAYNIFNEINSTNDFDVHCSAEKRTFSRMKRRVCRAQFENRIQAQAAKEYMHELFVHCGGQAVTASCVFSAAGQQGLVRVAAVESQIPGKREELNQEIVRLANEDPRFAQAILDYYEASQELKAASTRRGDD
jgi:hypothetical protein